MNNKDGELILEIAGPYDLLATFFAADIQQDPELCRYYLDRVTKVLDGESFHTDLTGNAHSVTVTKTTTIVTSLFDHGAAPAEIETDRFKEVLEKWHEILLK